MRYANYIHRGKYYNNLGDQLQILAIDYIYQRMGLEKKDIIYIDKDHLCRYDGPPVILPVSMPLINYNEHGIAGMFSPNITPVFLGLTLAKDFLAPEEVAYYKSHEPIGCRDERTYDTLCSYGITAYLGGCLSLVLPKRPDTQKGNKIFVIDPTGGLYKFFPAEIIENGIIDTHYYYGRLKSPREKAIERYHQYANEASLVITSLLHCSIPCMAMGIPVILAKDVVSYRFGWVEALLHIYTPNEYEKIRWAPEPIYYEEHKQLHLKFIMDRLWGDTDTAALSKIHSFFMERDRNRYVNDAFMPIENFINTNWKNYDVPHKYAVWGLTQMSEITVNYIQRRYPNARLCHVYDARYTDRLNGIAAEHPSSIVKHSDETVFVTTVSAYEDAKQFFEKIGRPKNTYMLLKTIV